VCLVFLGCPKEGEEDREEFESIDIIFPGSDSKEKFVFFWIQKHDAILIIYFNILGFLYVYPLAKTSIIQYVSDNLAFGIFF
jgi:hypothetical protein